MAPRKPPQRPKAPPNPLMRVTDTSNPDRNVEVVVPFHPDKRKKAWEHSFGGGEANRNGFLALMTEHPEMSIKDLAQLHGISPNTYKMWRTRFPAFAARCDAARQGNHADVRLDYRGGFAPFRKAYFGHESPWFHLEVVNALEDAEQGSVTLILLPPEHGKTSLLEDYCNFKLALDPSYRITIASEKSAHGRKAIKRIKARMDRNGPCPAYVDRFGPFMPEGTGQPWAADYFDVFKRAVNSDERDYNMSCVGIDTAVAGTRCDLLILDDIQSLKSLGRSADIVEVIRQDFLSRPGSLGKTVIIGTRVGNNDVYERLEEAGIVDRVVRYPALNHKGEYLWPERYTPENYARMRRNVGEEAWARNYQQQPRAAAGAAFPKEQMDKAKVPLRSIFHKVTTEYMGIMLGLDPGFGTNAWVACAYNNEHFAPWAWRIDHGLTNNGSIMRAGAELCAQVTELGNGVPVTDLILEDKAFQKGLLNDDAFLEFAETWGCRIDGHQTGNNKYDADFGVGAMAASYFRNEIQLPGGDDEITRTAVDFFIAQHGAWRPNRKGTQLTQDLVMAVWFPWIRWRNIRRTAERGGVNASIIRIGGVPFGPTRVTVGGRRL